MHLSKTSHGIPRVGGAVLCCVPGCSPAGTPGQSSPSSAGRSGPGRPVDPGSDGRCGSSGGPSAAAVSLAVTGHKHTFLVFLTATVRRFEPTSRFTQREWS